MPQLNQGRPTYSEIELNNLRFNFNSVKRFVGEQLSYMAVVKADAYGHGAVECARTLENSGIDCFGVAIVEEAVELRLAGISKPLICLGGFWEGQEDLIIENRLSPVVYRLDAAERLNDSAAVKKTFVDVHLKVDTGMGRIGVRCDCVNEFAEKLLEFRNLNVKGVMTHFAAADDLAENDFTNVQIERFYDAVSILEAKGFRPLYKDLANSPGAIAHGNSRGNLIRLGGVLYGLGDDVLPASVSKPELKPVMSVRTKISCIKKVPAGESLGYSRTFKTKRDSIIATIPIGYYDGYRRNLSNKSKVIIRRQFAPVVGNISMDWTIIDVTDIAGAKINDDVTVIGREGNLSVTAADLAKIGETISYEITCGISRRVRKIYI